MMTEFERKITGEAPIEIPTSPLKRYIEARKHRRLIARKVEEPSVWARVLGVKCSIVETWESLPNPQEW